jgi:hypothetical protein
MSSNSDEESLRFEDLRDDDESSLESSIASCPEEQSNSNLGDCESTVRESSLGSLWADSSVESPLLSDVECSGSQEEGAVTFEQDSAGFSLNSSCEVDLPEFAMERRQLVMIADHSRETTCISLESEDSGDNFGSSSDFGVLLHLPPSPIILERTKNHMTVQVFGTLGSAPGVKGRSNNNVGADTINFDKQFDVLHAIACPVQCLRYDGFMNEQVSHNSSEIQKDVAAGNCSSSIIESTHFR